VTTAVIGTGGLGSVTARLLAAGGENLRLSSGGYAAARALAAEIGPAPVAAAGNADAVQGSRWAATFTISSSGPVRARSLIDGA
jgi:predicted dinucleotide-binding enzyme